MSSPAKGWHRLGYDEAFAGRAQRDLERVPERYHSDYLGGRRAGKRERERHDLRARVGVGGA